MLGGCENANSEPENTNAITKPSPVMASTNAGVSAKPIPEAEVPTGQAVNAELTIPATVKLTPAATEIAKLAQAGIDSNVMLAYVTNSIHTFNLAPDEIVYFNDIGLPPAVVTAMIQHDQQIRDGALTGAASAPGNAPSVWSGGQVVPNSDSWQQPAAEPAPAAQSEAVPTAPPPPPEERPTEVTENYFYDSLAPYGTWIDIAGYGRCWRPTVVATYPGWQPYCHGGRWVWTDCGWYWYSDYSWGWAPFHYGRWFSHPRWGWCWVPGSLWGPSWVSWRYSDSYCGWAPLPPAACYTPGFGFSYYGSSCGSGFSFGLSWGCFTFVSYNNFHGHHYDRHCVSHHQAAQVYNQTTVVNNIIRGDNNTIINHGIGPDRITAATGTPIHPVRITESHGPRGANSVRHEQLGSNGRTLTTVRANVPTRNDHQVAGGATPPPREGAHGLTSGSASAGHSTSTVRGNGTRLTVPPRAGETTATPPNSSPLAAHEPTRATHQAAPVTPAVREQTPPGSLIIRSPRSPRTTVTPNAEPAPVVVGNAIAPSAPIAAPAITPPPTSGTTRSGGSRATPWLNPPAPAQNQPMTTTPGNSRQGQTPRNTRSDNQIPSPFNNSSPVQVAPPMPRSGATYAPPSPPRQAPAPTSPRYERGTPPQSYMVPAPSQPAPPTYSPPARSQAPHNTPSPQSPPRQSYSPPQSAPSSPPPASGPPPSRSSGSGSSDRGGGRSSRDR